VADAKLLAANPWGSFSWVMGTARPIRQFGPAELVGLLRHVESAWPAVTTAAAALKVFLWSGGRKSEVAGLTWDMLRAAGGKYHFAITGKAGVARWFRVPAGVHRELRELRTGSPYVFASYTEQIRRTHAGSAGCLGKIRDDFVPANFGRWVYERVKEWVAAAGGADAYLHVFRKTALQHARRGEDLNRQVAADARVGEAVMMRSYVREADEELRARSNRTYARILASLPPEVASRYGHPEEALAGLEQQARAAAAAGDWERAAALSAVLAKHGKAQAG
jgi:integrase